MIGPSLDLEEGQSVAPYLTIGHTCLLVTTQTHSSPTLSHTQSGQPLTIKCQGQFVSGYHLNT